MKKTTSKESSQDYVKSALQEYGTYVVEDRAVPDFRDGLKPVQRRILWAMHVMGLHHKAETLKSSQVTGVVMGRYHPHGDSYGSVVGLVNLRHPLVDGQGSFGDNFGEEAAASRYTEVRLQPLSELIVGRDDSVLELSPTYDGKYEEPVFLPAELPVLFLNGSQGIAVGISCEIPPHNRDEVIDSFCDILEGKPDWMRHVAGPDYGYGVLLSPREQIEKLYSEGQGQLSFRCNYVFEKLKNGSDALVVTSWAPKFNIPKFLSTLSSYREAGNIVSISNESSTQVRIVIEFTNARFIQDHVLKLLETSVSYRFYANKHMEDGTVETKTFTFKRFAEEWLAYYRNLELKYLRAEESRYISELKTILIRLKISANIKEVSRIVTQSDNPEAEILGLLGSGFDKSDADYVLDKISLRSLGKLNSAVLEKKKTVLESSISAVKQTQANIDTHILKTLRSRKTGEQRLTLVGAKRPKLQIPEDAPNTWILATGDGDILRIDGSPDQKRGSFKYDYVSQVGHSFWLILKSGLMQRIETASLALGKSKNFGPLAGILDTSFRSIAVLDSEGLGLIIDATTLKKDKYQSIKTSGSVVSVVGLRDTDKLLAYSKKASYIHSVLETSRVNSSGWKLLPRFKSGASGLLAIRDDKLFAVKDNIFKKIKINLDSHFDVPSISSYVSERVLVVSPSGKTILDSSKYNEASLTQDSSVFVI